MYNGKQFFINKGYYNFSKKIDLLLKLQLFTQNEWYGTEYFLDELNNVSTPKDITENIHIFIRPFTLAVFKKKVS